MNFSLILQSAFFLLLLAISAFCSSSESAFFSLNPLDVRRIAANRKRAADAIHELLARPARLLSSILITNTVVNTALSALGYFMAETYFPHKGQAIAIPLMTVLLVIFGEMGPKRVGMLYSRVLAVWYLPAVNLTLAATAPLRFVLERFTSKLQPLFKPRGRTLSQEEFETVVDLSREQGMINAEELGMIKAVMRLDELRVSDVMTPRVDLVGVRAEELKDKALEAALAAKVNFLIVYRDSLDNVEALLDVRKFLLDPERDPAKALVKPMYTPEACTLSRLLAQFQKQRSRIAIVVDEYGGTAGVITRGDILEQIAGEVYEEMAKPRPVFQPAGPYRWLVDAGFSIEELNRKLMLKLDGGDMDRLAGWIAQQLGHVPMPNETVEAQGCRVTVLKTRNNRVMLAQIEKIDGVPA